VAQRTTDTAEVTAPATVMVSQRVKPGREGDYRQWQAAVDRAVAPFVGFRGTEVVPPGDAEGEWTVIYRFDSKEHLDAWLGSAEREEAMSRGADLFAGPASQQVLVEAPEEHVVTAVVTHQVEPGREDEFVAWNQRLTDAEATFPGFQGSEIYPPVPGVQDEWTIVFRFDTDEHLSAWLDSPERKRLLDEGREFERFELRRIAGPFGSWFSLAGGPAGPAQWKTALSVLVGLYPTVVFLTITIAEIWDGPLWATLLLGNALSTILLTWVVMPVVTRGLHWWLAPEGRADARLDTTGTVVSIAFLTFAAFLFWLITTQIWTLP
jgi:antibiotic biosynthesis monooxygenase (ABM) superfamily enzyme